MTRLWIPIALALASLPFLAACDSDDHHHHEGHADYYHPAYHDSYHDPYYYRRPYPPAYPYRYNPSSPYHRGYGHH